MGGLGFGLPGAAGLRMALPDRPVVAVVGDGSAMFGIQALWSAARYRAGALFVVLANDGYAVMDRLAERNGGGHGPWPAFGAIDVAAMARAQGCDARRIENRDELARRARRGRAGPRPPREAAAPRGGRGGRHDVQPVATVPVFMASSTRCSVSWGPESSADASPW